MNGDVRDALDEELEAAQQGGTAGSTADAAGSQSDGDDAQRGDAGDDTRRELAALTDRHLRLAAEFDNYRKRTERDRSEAWSRAQADLAAALLEALDDLQRVTQVSPESASVASVLEGVQLVERKLLRTLEGAGLEEVEAEGQLFDPTSMEALMTVDAESAEQDDVVADVFQKGYRFKGQLLRPARVRVRKYHG